MFRKKRFFKIHNLFTIKLLIAGLIFLSFCFASGNEKQKDDVWGETYRPPRENFKPDISQQLFSIEKSILKNPSFLVETKGKLPTFWFGSLRIWKEVYKSPDYFSKMVTIEQDPEIPFQGKPSVKIHIAPSEEEVYLELYQKIDMQEKNLKGKKLRLSFYAYRKNPPTGKEFFITGILLNKEESVVLGTTINTWPYIPPGKWIFFSQEGIVKEETDIFKFSLRFISGGNDTVWLSGFLLEEVQ